MAYSRGMQFSISDDRLLSIRNLLYRIKLKRIQGNTAELGVFRGGTSRYIADLMGKHGKTHYAIDSFDGLPEPKKQDGKVLKKIWKDRGGDFFKYSYAKVEHYFKPLTNIKIINGFFPDCVTVEMENDRYSFVHLDGDIYQTTLDGLEFFWPRMNVGGIIAIDDYGCRKTPGCKIAFDEYFKGNMPRIYDKTLPQIHIMKGNDDIRI